MRESCLDCARKHLGIVEAVMDEVYLGYSQFFWKIIGEMNEASSELLKKYPEMAAIIRDRRVEMMKNRRARKKDASIALYDPKILELTALLDSVEDQEIELEIAAEQAVNKPSK